MKLKIDKKTVRELYAVLMSLALVALGIAFIAECIIIYSEGANPFSRERVALAISSISALIWIFFILLIGAIPVHLLCSAGKEKLKPYKMSKEQLESLTERLALSPTDDRRAVLEKERSLRRTLLIGALGICILMLVYPLIYIFIPSNFTTEAINDDVAHAVLSFIPSIAVIIGSAIAYSYLSEASVERESAALKQIAKESPSLLRAKKKTHVDTATKKTIFAVRVIFLTLAVSFIVIGVFNGGAKDVLSKAIKLCTECVGLG